MRLRFQSLQIALALGVALAARNATAQSPDASTGAVPPDSTPASSNTAISSGTVTISGYAETYYQWNFNQPSNGITDFRGFDNRHNTFTLSNVALDAHWDTDDMGGRLTLQAGHTPSTYYLSEPQAPGTSSSNSSSIELWKFIQQAYADYRFRIGGGLVVSAGLFLSPIGPENMAIKDNWNWSRSNLFFGLPFYHTGVKSTYTLPNAWAITLAAYNGWNSVVDNNPEKSVSTQFTYTTSRVVASLLYLGGVERPLRAAEGKPWRHLFDGHITWHASPQMSILAHANTGFEPNTFGVSHWLAGALYFRFQAHRKLYLAVRADAFSESVPRKENGQAAAIFWPSRWVASGTATVDFRPHEKVSFRGEYRHDHAASPVYFGGNVDGDGREVAFVPNRSGQDTFTVGVTSWF